MTTPSSTPETSRLKRTAKGSALVALGLVAGLAASQVEQISNLLRGTSPETSANTPEAGGGKGKAPEATPGSIDAPNPLQNEARRLRSEMHQYLNSQSLTVADCDREIERVIADASNPKKTENIDRWQRLKSFVILDAQLMRIVEELLQPGANVQALVAQADRALNPNLLTAEQVRAAQAEYAARGDLQAEAMAIQLAVSARQLELFVGIRTFAGNVSAARRS